MSAEPNMDTLGEPDTFETKATFAILAGGRLAKRLDALRNDLVDDPILDPGEVANTASTLLDVGLDMLEAVAVGRDAVFARGELEQVLQRAVAIRAVTDAKLAHMDEALRLIHAAGLPGDLVSDRTISCDGGLLNIKKGDKGVHAWWEPARGSRGGLEKQYLDAVKPLTDGTQVAR